VGHCWLGSRVSGRVAAPRVPRQSTVSSMATPVFVGRQRELALLSDLAAKARADQPQVVLVEGEAGMGKSTLLARLASTVGTAAVLRASGEESESTLGYGVIGQLAAGARRLGVATPALLGDQLDDSLDPLAVGAELVALFDALGRSGQLELLLVDDLHWCDPLSARALLFGLRRLGADRVLAVLTARPGELARHGEGWYRFVAGDERATRVQLGALEIDDVMKLSRELGTGELSPRAATSLVEHTAGNPLYCVALLQELQAEHLDRAQGPPRVPRDLASLVLVKVARLSPPARELVTAAAVLGPRCPLAVAVALAGIEEPLEALEQTVNASLLAEGRGELGTDISFVHPLVWSAVYEDLGPARRRELHRRAAGLVERERSLAHRVAAVTGPDEALAADLEAAAREAQAKGRTAVAAALFTQAATASADVVLREHHLLDALETHLAGGDVVGAEALAPLIERVSPSARRSALLGNLDLFAGRLARAEERLAEVWQAHDQEPWPLAGVVCEQITVSLIFGGMQGRVDQSILWGRRAVEASAGSPSIHNRALGLLSLALVSGYRATEALSLPEHLPGPVGNVAVEDLDALILRGIARLWAGYPEPAYQDLAHSAARLRGGVSARYAGLCLTYLAGAEYLLGAWDDALAHAELSVSLVRDAGYAMWSAIAHHYAALVPAGRGDFDVAARHIEAAHAAEASLGRAWAGAVSAEAVLAMARGAPDDALRAVTKVREEWKANWFGPVGLLDWRSLEVEALLALGDVDQAAQRLIELEQLHGDGASPLARTGLARLKALVAIGHGDHDRGARAFADAWRHAAGCKLPLVLAQLEMDEARFLRQSGERERALERLHSAAARLSALGARPYAQRCDQELARCDASARPEEMRRELGLTEAEFAVARSVARGLTNKEAAGELYVSSKTIEFHLSRIYMKLGLRSRRELARLLGGAQTAQLGL
jgi:DNA-binding CsgD family transcriptional regulator/tetratricopeptide (TPR) repeat protein